MKNIELSGGSIHRPSRPVALGNFHPFVNKSSCFLAVPTGLYLLLTIGAVTSEDLAVISKDLRRLAKHGIKKVKQIYSSPFVNKMAGSDEHCHGLDVSRF